MSLPFLDSYLAYWQYWDRQIPLRELETSHLSRLTSIYVHYCKREDGQGYLTLQILPASRKKIFLSGCEGESSFPPVCVIYCMSHNLQIPRTNAFYWLVPFNPLTLTGDHSRISPYNINTISSRQVMRLTKNINQEIINYSNFCPLFELQGRQKGEFLSRSWNLNV